MTIDPELFTGDYCYFFDNRYIIFAHHSSFSYSGENQFLKQIEQGWSDTNFFLKQANFLFITFGTAYCYKFFTRNLVVTNCHKIPNAQFEKFRLTIDEIAKIYKELAQNLLKINPSLKIIFTVSPVRHLGDGFHENQLSKSVLHLAIEQLTNGENIFYFPAYEIMMDDLRDYRFYAEDLCHVGENGAHFIEEVFAETFFSQTTKEKQKEIEKENKFLNHKPLK
jgi:hypothetical protein